MTPVAVRSSRWTDRHLQLLIALLPALVTPAAAQTLRDYDYARPLRGERQLRAVVEFAAGRLTVKSGAADKLYRLVLQYDAERFEPIGSYNPAAAEARLGVSGTGSGGIRVRRRKALPQTAVVEFPGSVDLALDVTMGAAEGNLDLGGLRLSEFDLATGASRTTVSFARPNAGSCRSASVSAGAGELEVTGAGNSGCRVWRFNGGVGAMTIDLGGAWPADPRMVFSMAFGGVTLVAPKDLGIRVRMRGFLAGFNAKGFTKEGKTWTSNNYAGAKRKVEIEVSSAIGGVKVEWR
jgi:hypothetical protein